MAIGFLLAELMVAILGGLLATGITVAIARLLPRDRRWALVQWVATLLDAHFVRVYPDKEAATPAVVAAIEDASTTRVRLFTSRGNDLSRDTFDSLLLHRGRRTTFFEVLLPNTSSEWIADRERELTAFDQSYAPGRLSREIANNIDLLQRQSDTGLITVHMYDYPHVGRIILTDSVAFLTPYHARTHGRGDPVIQCSRGDPLYDFLDRLFEKLSSASPPPPPAETSPPWPIGH